MTASTGSADAATLRELEEGGAPPDVLEYYRGRVESDVFELCCAGFEAFQVFSACRAQHEVVPGATSARRFYMGLDRAEIAAVMDMLDIPRPRRAALLRQVLLIERGAIEASRAE